MYKFRTRIADTDTIIEQVEPPFDQDIGMIVDQTNPSDEEIIVKIACETSIPEHRLKRDGEFIIADIPVDE